MVTMDCVVVTHGPDVKLLRHCLASWELYYQTKGKLLIIIPRADASLLEQAEIPHGATILFAEDIVGAARPTDAFVVQQYIKLAAYRYVSSEYYFLIDSDFLFIRPTSDEHFFHRGRPVWFCYPWEGHGAALRWKADSERFLGFAIDKLFSGTHQQYVLKKEIATDLASRYGLERLWGLQSPNEWLVYGAFAHRVYPEAYEFVVDTARITPISINVNQIPPDYCHLDPTCSYEEYSRFHFVVFWSHWDLAEAKMIEFFERSQIKNLGSVVREPDRRRLFPTMAPEDLSKNSCRRAIGVYADGWVTDRVSFRLKTGRKTNHVQFDLLVPECPTDVGWSLSGEASLGSFVKQQAFSLKPGLNSLQYAIPESLSGDEIQVDIRFGQGFEYEGNVDRRVFRAQLMRVLA